MSGRRRRYETAWDDKEEKRTSAEIHSNVSPGRSRKWSKSELHDDLMRGNFSRSPSWDPLQGNRNGPKDDDIRRDKNRMYSHPNFDGREKQYSAHPSDDSYGLPYRSWDKGEGGNVRMSREPERERTSSPNGSRSRSRDGMGRSSRESTRSHRHETNVSYPNMRNSSKDFASRGGGNNIPESWSRRTEYKDGSRYDDQPHRNVYDDHRNTRIPCKFFAAGNCNRGNCRFSHDVPEAAGGYDDNRNLGNTSRTWCNDQQPRDDLNANSKHAKMDKKYNSSWDDVKSGSFDETSRQGHASDENNNNATWDSWDDRKKLDGHASCDASGFHDVGNSHPNLDNKKSSWNGPTSWGGESGSGFGGVSNPCTKYEETTKEFLDDDGAMGRMCAKSSSNIGGSKRKKWDGPLWDEVSEPVVVETDNKKIRKWEGPGLEKMTSDNVETAVNESDLNTIASENAEQVLTSGKDLIQNVHDMDTQSLSYADGSKQSYMLRTNPFNGPLKAQAQGMYMVMENQNKPGKDLIQNVRDMNTHSLLYADGSKQSRMLLSNPFNGPLNGPLNGQVQGMYMDTENQNKPGKDLIQNVHDMYTQSLTYADGPEQSRIHLSNLFNGPLNGQVQGMYMDMENQNNGGKPLKPLEMSAPQPQAVNHVIETSLTSHQASQENELPAEISHKEQLSQLYTDLHLSNAIDYLKSLPSSAYSQDTKAKEEQNSVKNTEDKTSAPMEILSGSVTQQNQMPADLTHDPSKLGGIGVMQKEAVERIDKRVAENRKKEEQSMNRDNSEAQGNVEEGDIGNDEKAMRQFKAGLVEFVKEILKPKWKEGKMSREVHKNVVKKVVEKVTSSIQGTQIPRTQPKIEQYLTHSKPKITKLVEAYMERLVKT